MTWPQVEFVHRKSIGVVPLLMLTLSFSCAGGCAAPIVATAGMGVAQAGTGAYVAGELRAARHITLDEGWQAAQLAVDDLGLDRENTVIGERRRYVLASEPRGPRFRITVERKAPMATRFRVRVGLIGDVALSRLTMRRIDHHLAEIASWTEFDEPDPEHKDETADDHH